MNNPKRLFIFLATGILLSIGIIALRDERWGFYFIGTLDEHKRWFPHFYIISYCLFKAYVPIFIGVSIFLVIDFGWEKKTDVLFVIKKLSLRSFFLFALYIILSWTIPEIYPFSKYPMYNSWGNEGAVFSLRDSKNQLIPLNKISKINGAKLSHIYTAEKRKNVNDSLAGKKMMEFLKANRNKSSIVRGEVSINKTILLWNKNTIYTNEIQLYQDTLE